MLYSLNIDNYIYTLLASSILAFLCYFSYKIEKDLVSPAVTFSLTWSVALFFLSFTPLLGFYPITNWAIIIFICGALFFSLSSFVTLYLLRSYYKTTPNILFEMNSINYKKLFWIANILSLIFVPLIIYDLLNLGDSLVEIAYKARYMSVNHEQIISDFSANYLLFGLFLVIIFFYGMLQNQISISLGIVTLLPYILCNLIVGGRAGLITLLLSSVFVYFSSGKKLNLKFVVILLITFAFILMSGAILVKKVEIDDTSFINSLVVMLEHIAIYAFQGPILFSKYFENSISIRENWSALSGVCHMLNKIELCKPVGLHADFAYFGYKQNHIGNVYTFYFSIYPKFHYLGIAFFTILYSSTTAFFYFHALRGKIFSMVMASYLYSAIILTIFSDLFGPNIWFFIKIYVFSLLVKVFFMKKINRTKHKNYR